MPQHGPDEGAFECRQRLGQQGALRRSSDAALGPRRQRRRPVVLSLAIGSETGVVRKIRQRNLPPGRVDGQPLTEIHQFTHVAGPIVVHHRRQRVLAQLLGRDAKLSGRLVEIDAGQFRNVLLAFTKGWNRHAHDVQSMIEVFPKALLLHCRGEILVRGGNDAHIHAHRCLPANAEELVLRQYPEQACLKRCRHVADLIQKQRAAVGLLEAAQASPFSPCKGPALVSEQFRFQQLGGDGRCIQRDERLVGPGRILMQRPGHQFLAGAGLTGDENRHAGTGQTADRTENLLHRGCLTDHPRRGRRYRRGDLFASLPGGLGHQFDGFVDIERLGQVFESAAPIGADRAVQIREGGDDDDRNVGVPTGELFHQVQPAHVGHANVGDDDIRLLAGERPEERSARFEAPRRHLRQRQGLLQHPAHGFVIVNDPDRDTLFRHQQDPRESSATGSLI